MEVWPVWDRREERGGTDGGRESQRKESATDDEDADPRETCQILKATGK